LVITMGGDVNFNKNNFYSHSSGFSPKNLRADTDTIPWDYFVENLKPMLIGDLNFANIETVITDNNSIPEEPKKFKFRTHPNALLHLAEIGFNFFNLSNNHAYDFKHVGMEETLKSFQYVNQQIPIHYFGVGKRSELLQPLQFTVKGYRVAFAAISIVFDQYQARDNRVGLLNIRSKDDYYTLVKNFRNLDADLKILSIHYGTEGKVTLDPNQKKYYEYAIDNGGVDLIIGHHPHAVRPVSLYKNKLIFYSLGNYMMLGSANITRKKGGADWGLFAKVVYTKKQRAQLQAVELQMLTQTHTQVKTLTGPIAQDRLVAYSKLSAQELGNDALPWQINSRFKGVYCPIDIYEPSALAICQSH
ncbi:MAG: CapA family protein, partial [Bdellovibrionales bacterium]|nr:CapA family protein [Bdellovibrionales bacterium]